MNRLVLGAFAALVMASVGVFWWQGRAATEAAAPPPDPAALAGAQGDPDELPSADVTGQRGPAPPESTELTREERRFFRYDRNRDRKITRAEMLSSRTDAFRDLDTDGNNLLTFEEWAITTAERFDEMDGNGNGELTTAEFATSAPRPRATPTPRCAC